MVRLLAIARVSRRGSARRSLTADRFSGPYRSPAFARSTTSAPCEQVEALLQNPGTRTSRGVFEGTSLMPCPTRESADAVWT